MLSSRSGARVSKSAEILGRCGIWPLHTHHARRRVGTLVATLRQTRKKMGWHTFRHTCATLLRASGADIKVAQELLRHASCRVTLDTYTQAITEHKRAALA